MALRNMPSRALIYGLVDPRNRHLRYIGKTHKRRELRLREHIEAARAGEVAYVYNWVRQLLAVNIEPEIFVLERVAPASKWQQAERQQISRWSESPPQFPYLHPPQTPKSEPVEILGVKLTNIRPGGESSGPDY